MPGLAPGPDLLTDYSGGIDAVIIPLVNWLSIYEPDLRPDEAVRFDAERNMGLSADRHAH